jgi:hypothetical protein
LLKDGIVRAVMRCTLLSPTLATARNFPAMIAFSLAVVT